MILSTIGYKKALNMCGPIKFMRVTLVRERQISSVFLIARLI